MSQLHLLLAPLTWAKNILFPSVPLSPKFQRKISRPSQPPLSPNRRARDQDCHPNAMPSTPPRPLTQLPTSSIRTPLSSKGINPAALSSEGDGSESKEHISKTPRKRIPSSGPTAVSPVTPRKLVFLTNQNSSPFRTPVGGFGTSPYRTPGSRGIFDPYDPGALLDEELNRMGTIGQGDSPAGLFGKGRGSLLYDSPGLSISPGRWW
jgi:DNA ligase-4